jgi:hypothetical protein
MSFDASFPLVFLGVHMYEEWKTFRGTSVIQGPWAKSWFFSLFASNSNNSFLLTAHLELDILLPQPPKCWDYMVYQPGQVLLGIFYLDSHVISK